MGNIRDFRPDAEKMALIANAKAKITGQKPVVELHHDEFVNLHCGGRLFIVYRDVIAAGSMYFESALFGFYTETYKQEIHFEDDVEAEVLDFYLNIAHSWFFEIKVLGIKIVSADIFKVAVHAVQDEPLKRAQLEIPKLKLAKMAGTIILADRFLHRSLLSIVRQMFLSLLDFTHNCWARLKNETQDWDMDFHQEIMYDYMLTFNLLSMGHDDEKYLRDALTESFYWLSYYTPSLREHFWAFMPHQFIAEWNVDRTNYEKTRMSSHAMGIFRTDQMIYASQTRMQKARRYKRVMNICSPDARQELLPWFEDAKVKRSRVAHLLQVIAAKQLEQSGFHAFIPGASSHGIFPHASRGATTGGGFRGGRRQGQARGGRRSRAGRQQARGGSAQSLAGDIYHGGDSHGGGSHQHGRISRWNQASQWPGVFGGQPVLTPDNGGFNVDQDENDFQQEIQGEGKASKKRNKKKKNRVEQRQQQNALVEQGAISQVAYADNASMIQVSQTGSGAASVFSQVQYPEMGNNEILTNVGESRGNRGRQRAGRGRGRGRGTQRGSTY